MARSIEKFALVWQEKKNISKTSELLRKSIAHPNSDSVTIIPSSSYCLDRKGAGYDLKLGPGPGSPVETTILRSPCWGLTFVS
jgi:hypothetical protein